MKVYESANDMFFGALKLLKESGLKTGSRDGETAEIIGWSGQLWDNNWNFVCDKTRLISPYYAAAETLWYLSGAQDIRMIQAYAPQYARFAENGIAHGAYGYRWRRNPGFVLNNTTLLESQLEMIIAILKKKSESRQAVITMYDSGDLYYGLVGGKGDIPCTLTMQFILRDRLHCIVNMRSNDVWLGLPYDVFAFTCIHRLVADELDVAAGTYTHNVGSLHYYIRNEKAIERCLDSYSGDGGKFMTSPMGGYCDIPDALQIEEDARVRKIIPDSSQSRCNLLMTLAGMAASRWVDARGLISEDAEKYINYFKEHGKNPEVRICCKCGIVIDERQCALVGEDTLDGKPICRECYKGMD